MGPSQWGKALLLSAVGRGVDWLAIPLRQTPGLRAWGPRREPSPVHGSEAASEMWGLRAGSAQGEVAAGYGGRGWGRAGRSATPVCLLPGSTGGASGLGALPPREVTWRRPPVLPGPVAAAAF